MASRRSDLEQIRRAAYFLQRDIGDYQAAERGPEVLAKRIVRRKAERGGFRLLGQIIRAMTR